MQIRFATDAARNDLTPVDNRFILDYLPHASGMAVSVYLYGLMQCSHASTADTPLTDVLGLSENAVIEAFSYWQEQGLVRIRSEKPLTVEYLSIPEGNAEPTVPGKYFTLISALNSLTAPRRLDVRELRHVYDWVEVYGLDEDAVLELVSHCMAVKGRRVSTNYISAVAQTWAENGIRTRADAIRYVESYNLTKHGASAILREWNKARKPTKAEMALYDKWTMDWGFSQQAILATLPRLSAAGTPSFQFLDEQLERLLHDNVVSREDILRQGERTDEERAFAALLFERAGKVEPATKTQRRQIAMYLTELHMPRELMLFGAEQCRGANEPFGLMKKIWNDWHEKGIATIEQAAAALKAGKADGRSAGKARRVKSVGYTQHDLSDEELDKLLIDLDKVP